MIWFGGLKANLAIWILLIIVVGCSATTPKNTPECKNELLLEAERIEKQLKKTVNESNMKLESIFVPENFGGDNNKALMMKGAYIAFFNNKFRDSILKIQAIPGAYKKAAQQENYPKACDNITKLKGANDKAINTHADIWEQALEVAKTFRQK